jgi:hypothetical protein
MDRAYAVSILTGDPMNSDPEKLGADMQRLIGDAILNLTAYPRNNLDQWSDWISISREQFAKVCEDYFTRLPKPRMVVDRVEGPYFVNGRVYRVVHAQVIDGGIGSTRQHWNGSQWVIGGWDRGTGNGDLPVATLQQLCDVGLTESDVFDVRLDEIV